MQRSRSESIRGLFMEEEEEQYVCSTVIKEKIGSRGVPNGGAVEDQERAYELDFTLKEMGRTESFGVQE